MCQDEVRLFCLYEFEHFGISLSIDITGTIYL